MSMPISAQGVGDEARVFGDDVEGLVELPLLLPVRRAEALVALSRERHETVGQIIRSLIDQLLVNQQAPRSYQVGVAGSAAFPV
jgi:hypothetical protein